MKAIQHLAKRNRARLATREEITRLLKGWDMQSHPIELADLLQRCIESGHFPHLAFNVEPPPIKTP